MTKANCRKLLIIFSIFVFEPKADFGRMRERLLLNICLIMSLSSVLTFLKNNETNVNHKTALIKTLLLVPKVANIVERITFLVECRKAQVFPKFIQNILTKTAIISSRSKSFEEKKRRFAQDLLNEAIKESFRKQAYLLREKKRREEDASRTRSSLWPWLQDQCNLLFEECREENMRRLASKLNRLKNITRNSDINRSCSNSSGSTNSGVCGKTV